MVLLLFNDMAQLRTRRFQHKLLVDSIRELLVTDSLEEVYYVS